MTEAILVTGSTGFVGRALTNRLRAEGHRVVEFSRSLGQDIRTEAAFEPYLHEGVGTVFHLAGRSFIPDSWRDPSEFYSTNTLGTARALDFCRMTGARIILLSSYVYGKPRYLPVDEGHPVCPLNPYTHSKWLAEELCRFFVEHFGVQGVIIRPFNIFGPGQPEQFLIASIVKQWINGREVVVHNLLPRRDYVYISDFIEACMVVYRVRDRCGVYNVGSGTAVSVEEVLRAIEAVSGERVRWRTSNQLRRDEIEIIVSSSRLVREGLWRPEVDFHEGLARVVDACRI